MDKVSAGSGANRQPKAAGDIGGAWSMEITISRYQHLIESNMTINQRPGNQHLSQARVLQTWYVGICWDCQHILAPSG